MTHDVQSRFFTGPLRSPSRLQNTFAHESFIDEVAAAVKADPVDYRLRHLSDPRLVAVVKAAARAANWDTRPSPRPVTRRAGAASGRGMSSVLYEGDNGYCAMVAEVEVDQSTGRVTVKRLVIAEGTVEDRIAQMLKSKRDLADAVLGSGEAALTELDDGQLRDLVSLRREGAVS